MKKGIKAISIFLFLYVRIFTGIFFTCLILFAKVAIQYYKTNYPELAHLRVLYQPY